MKPKQLANGRSIMTDENGQPILTQLVMRTSDESSSTLSAALLMPVPTDDDESQGFAPLPFAAPSLSLNGYLPNGFTPEFLLEMN